MHKLNWRVVGFSTGSFLAVSFVICDIRPVFVPQWMKL